MQGVARAVERLRIVQAATVIGLILLLGALFSGWLAVTYEAAWTQIGGEPWTFIMRRNPWIWPIAVAILWFPSARWLPLRLWVRWIYGVVLLSLGFLGGHVFWP